MSNENKQNDERAAFDDVKPLVDEWMRSRETCMDGAAYGAAIELAAFVAARATQQATTGDERAAISHKLHVPPRGDEEPTALLMYGEDQFEIGYTLMHWLVGVIAMGAEKSGVSPQVLENAKSAFSFVDSVMCWDANPPEQTGEHADMLRRVGYTLTRPTFKIPYPEVAEYEAGHTPKPFEQRAIDRRHVAGSAGQAPFEGSPAFALRGLYKPAMEYFVDGKPVTPDEYIAWQATIIEAVTKANLPDPKYYGGSADEGDQHDVKCAYVDGWNDCRSSILATPTAPSLATDAGAVLNDVQRATIQAAADSAHRVLIAGGDGGDELSDAGLRRELKESRDMLRALLAAHPTEQRMSDAACDVLAERARQVSEEGWTPAHDDEYQENELSRAAACYALGCGLRLSDGPVWPWDWTWWKPTTPRRNLVKAAALLFAEIERIDRAARNAEIERQGGEA